MTYHVAMTPRSGPRYCLAVDSIGKTGWAWLRDHSGEYGLRQFWDIGNEPWHLQPIEIPTGRRRYDPLLHEPLAVWDLPGLPDPQSQQIEAPTPTLRRGANNNMAEVREWQSHCNFWKWRDGFGRPLLVDGGFGPLTEQATMAAQKALLVDLSKGGAGVYGPQTARKFQDFLNYMAST
jgi:peptidoglycan hydrolase-like protein with peptidoglycan-binding domain